MAGTGPTGPGSRGKMISGINVTPLVDIVLVLLIIFLVTAKFTSQTAVPLDLPKASESEALQTIFSVEVPVEGTIHVDGKPIDLAALDARAADALERDPELRAVIQADGDVPHRRVMAVMDALRAGGLTRVAFGTQPEAADAPAEEADDTQGGELGTAN